MFLGITRPRRRGFVPVLIAIGIVSMLGVMSLTASMFSGLLNRKQIRRLNTWEAFYANELSAWHFLIRTKDSQPTSNNPLQIENDYASSVSGFQADPYSIDRGVALNILTTMTRAPASRLMRRYDGTNVSYKPGTKSGQYCGNTRFKQEVYRGCLFERVVSSQIGLVITYSDTNNPDHTLITGKVATNFRGTWLLETPPGIMRDGIPAGTGSYAEMLVGAFYNSQNGLLLGPTLKAPLSFFPWIRDTWDQAALLNISWAKNPFSLSVNKNGKYLALSMKDSSNLHAWEGIPGNWQEYDISAQNFTLSIAGNLSNLKYLQHVQSPNGDLHILAGMGIYPSYCVRRGGEWLVPPKVLGNQYNMMGSTIISSELAVDKNGTTHIVPSEGSVKNFGKSININHVRINSLTLQDVGTDEIASLVPYSEMASPPTSVNRVRIALDPRSDKPYFLYWSLTNPNELRLAHQNGNQYLTETVATLPVDAPFFGSKALAIGPDGTIYVAYLEKSGTFIFNSEAHRDLKPDDHASLKLATKKNGAWAHETIDNSGTVEFVHDLFVVQP